MAHKKMKLKATKKTKKHFKIKLAIYLMIIYISFAYTFYYSFQNKKSISNEEFINLLITTGNANILKEYKTTNIVNKTMNFLFNIDFTKPVSFLNTSILKYGTQKDNTKTISLSYNDDYSNMDELAQITDYIEDPNPQKTTDPIIYIYNSHQLENYSDKDLNIYGITPNVLMASYVLRESLNELGINTIVEEANMSEILARNNWNHAYSYQASRSLVEEKKKKHPSLKYFIDLHRDSISHDYSTATINNQSYAKTLFVIGQEHPNWAQNNSLAEQLNSLLNKNYPGLSRGIMLKQGPNCNGIYNQDLSPNSILIEVGGPENTIEEVYNTIKALADILNKHIKGGTA